MIVVVLLAAAVFAFVFVALGSPYRPDAAAALAADQCMAPRCTASWVQDHDGVRTCPEHALLLASMTWGRP